jgi:hypothetical protein
MVWRMRCHGLEELVRCRGRGSVDVLEPVEVQEQHRERGAVALRVLDGIGQVAGEVEPVGSPVR